MEITYRILGGDGKEYGPATQPQLQSWISEGRIAAETQVSRSDDGPWRPASQYAEFNWPPPTSAPASIPAAAAQPQDFSVLERQMRNGAGWFYWIAGLSAVNTISALSGSNWRFVVGLSLTQLFDAFALQVGGAAFAVALTGLVLGAFVLFGVFAHKRHVWAFIVGMVLYGLDAVLALVFQDWINLAFHAFALWGLFAGVKAALALNKLPRAS